MTRSLLVEAAYAYLGLGLRVMALGGKLPNGLVHPHWKEDHFTGRPSLESIVTAFDHPKTTGIGILTGAPYYVVDIDGPEGAEAWLALVGKTAYEPLIGGPMTPDRWVAKTGRGLHLWVASIESFPTAKLADKLDFKGEGGYVAAPPSRHPSGHLYEWLLAPGSDLPPMEMPDELFKRLMRKRIEAEARLVNKQQARATAKRPLSDGKWYPVATFDGIIDRMKAEREGNRNGILYWAARTMLEEGADEEDLEELLDAAVANGLTRRETRRTVQSAVEALGG